ncbi:MAG: hypothetical protein KAT46_07740, partial [Deltaproteobacteria bacterium]|nr:hypothetical protein [Deltaproteobacteria bacterium]
EGEALRAYLELLKIATTPREKVVLTRLLEMERTHQKVLRWELESIDEQGFWCGIMDYNVEKEVS